jgi:hypothetical protein
MFRRSIFGFLLLCVGLTACLPSRTLGFFQESIELGTRRELFVDKYLIESLDGVWHKLHEPTPTAAMDQPANDMEYGTIIHDGDLFRMYTREGRGAKFDGDDKEVTRYCESKDGIHWTKPNLGLVELDGSAENNIVLKEAPYCHNFAPFLDENPAASKLSRFKALAGTVKSGLVAFESADGIRWKKIQSEPVIEYTKEYAFDSQNVAFWSVSEGQYVCYFRHFLEGKLRSICRTTSKDFIHWSEPVPMRPNLPEEHLYTSLTHPYFRAPHIYIATPTRFFPNADNRTDILFMTARGDKPFDRTFRQAWIRPGLDSDRWGNRANYAAWHIVQTGPAEMSLYTTPFRRFTLRLDGFASIHADADPGRMTTKVFTMSGDRLMINGSTSAAGSIRVELTEPDGKPIEGFGLKDCQVFVGDAIDAPIVWKSGSSLQQLRGRPLRAKFELKDADLYAIEFRGEDQRRVDFQSDLRPIFEQRCFACHGALKQQAGLRLDTAAAIHQGGESGAVIDRNHASKSLLIQRVTTQDTASRMPPEGHALEENQVQLLAAWIDQGAPIPAIDQPEPDPNQHWAFQVPQRPSVPVTGESVLHPIDAFLQQSWREQGVVPQGQADAATRIRRVYLDLIGLPPSPEVIERFEADASEQAYAKIVEELLASPQYGERWARHWMDVWRYADWFGRRYVPDVWNSAPQIWRWRDWIVESLNQDVGYDQMIREMIAADEIKPGDPKSNVATGYLVRNWYALNPNDWMRNNIEHSSKAFLGLTFHCAHCHDHKYDPISQDNYFQFRAFFEPIYLRQDRLAGQADPGPFQDYEYSTLRKVQRLGRVGVFDKSPETPTWFYTGGDERNRQTDRGSIPANVPDFLNAAFEQPIEPVSLPPHAWYPGLDPQIIETMIQESDTAVAQAQEYMDTKQEALDAVEKTDEAKAYHQKSLDRIHQIQQQLSDLRSQSSPQHSAALSGQQSLLLDAKVGRRMIYRAMPEIPSVQEGDQILFLVRILSDAHFNFQLTRNNSTGATATYVGFEKGAIKSYKPSSFEEFEVGKFDSSGDQTFEVQLTLHPGVDQCTLKITRTGTQGTLVEDTKIALNGWNPVGDPTKGILFDARPGCVAVVDDWKYRRAVTDGGDSDSSVIAFDFESDKHPEDSELVGSLDWTSSKDYSISPATSKIVRSLPSLALSKLEEELAVAQRALERNSLVLESAKANLEWRQASRADLQSRIDAERAKYLGDPQLAQESIAALSHRAAVDEKMSQWHRKRVEWIEATKILADMEAGPVGDSNRPKELEAGIGRLAKAVEELEAARKLLEKTQKDAAGEATYKPLSPQYPKTSSGRRRALAHWMSSPKNPLTARVGVNHIWMRHFHQPLVRTVFDFGRNGATPTHPQLLDWLAVEWMECGWSIKHLHRLIVTSQAYQRQSSVAGNLAQEKDPENRLYWRMNAGRMEVEVLRDSILQLSGKLVAAMGGQELENKDIFTTYRRTLYYSCQPEEDGKSSLGMLFDGPDASDCYRRTRTVIPQQSLALTNSPLVHELSPLILQRIESGIPQEQRTDNSLFVDAAYRSVLGRIPSPEELPLCLDYLKDGTDPQNRRSSLIRVLLNHNDFITIR